MSAQQQNKMLRQNRDLIWIVVFVESGVPGIVEAYRDKKTAVARECEIRKDVRPEYDELGVYQIEIGKRDDEN